MRFPSITLLIVSWGLMRFCCAINGEMQAMMVPTVRMYFNLFIWFIISLMVALRNPTRIVGIPPLNPRNVNLMQRLSKQTGIAATDDGREKWFHLPETIGQLGRER